MVFSVASSGILTSSSSSPQETRAKDKGTIREIKENKSKLSVALYVNHDDEEIESVDVNDVVTDWDTTSNQATKSISELINLLEF